jgi:hypothetical protein
MDYLTLGWGGGLTEATETWLGMTLISEPMINVVQTCSLS